MNSRVTTLTGLALIAFAANSLLCRVALRAMEIDPAAFTTIRVVSGALVLWVILAIRRQPLRGAGTWGSALALFAYALAFSFAYLALSAGTGALLLFAAVQTTMIAWGLRQGERFAVQQWIGLVIALTGLFLLLLPGFSTPPPGASVMMLLAGVSWGVYSLRGKSSDDPVRDTAGNFLRAAPMATLLGIVYLRSFHAAAIGVACAIVSGAITSALGYIIWYSALPQLKATTAATVQLSVPVLAAAGGILLLREPLTLRFAISAVAVLGGLGLVVFEQHLSRAGKRTNG
jgi:drug/metabolite transporter (DMT)-like permease